MFIAEPLPIVDAVDEAKTYLRIDGDDDDGAIAALMITAAHACEADIGSLIINREVSERLTASSRWTRLGAAPVSVIESVAGVSAIGAPIVLGVGDYAIDIDANGDGWVRVTAPGPATAIDVNYRAGTAVQWDAVAPAIRHGIVRLASHYFTHRDAADTPAIPADVRGLWRPFRKLALGAAAARSAA